MLQFLKKTALKLGSNIRELQKSHLRSPHWSALRDQHLKEHGECAACGSKNHLQVHHIKPFHLQPELELDPDNLVTLCMDEWDCHLAIGHGGSFHTYNPHVMEDAYRFHHASGNRTEIIAEAKKGREPL